MITCDNERKQSYLQHRIFVDVKAGMMMVPPIGRENKNTYKVYSFYF